MDAGGTPYSVDGGDVYHSAAGATGQARHVFLDGNDLPGRWRGRRDFTIVEIGFGLGLNFLETWRTFINDRDAPDRLNFVSIEHRPLAADQLSRIHVRWPEHAERSRALIAQWPLPVAGFHRLHFAAGRITLTLLLGEALDVLRELNASVDAFFLDGFSPAKNPAPWSIDVCRQLARVAAPNATLATWSVASTVRDSLTACGFHVEKRVGFGGKREMLAGELKRSPSVARHGSPDSALIVGAGIAGCALAERLAARGCHVTLIESHSAPACEASGNPAALASPLINFADEANAQLSRASFLYARAWYASLDLSTALSCRGVLRLARLDRDADRFAQLLSTLAYPEALATFADVNMGSRLAGHAVARAGMWMPGGFSVSLAHAANGALNRWPDRIARAARCTVAAIEQQADGWLALDATGRPVAKARVAILACGTGLSRFPAAAHIPLERVRGQVSLLPASASRRLDVAISGDRHALLLPDGRIMIGATFQPGDDLSELRSSDHTENMVITSSMLPGLCAGLTPADLDGRIGFRSTTPDRIPVFGQLAPDLYVTGALGARGAVWAPLGAELIAAQITGEPWPLPSTLCNAAHPARFAKVQAR